MAKRTVVFLGNCQAFGLHRVYAAHLAVGQSDQAYYVDATKTISQADKQTLARADVLVSQVFDFPTQFSSEMVGAQCKLMRYPSVIAGFYWPYASQAHVFSPSGDVFTPYPAQLGDRYLNGLINKKVDPATALKMYLELDIVKAAGLERLFELNIEQQKKRDKESGFAIAALIEKRFRDEPLFLTPDHPELTVFWAVAERVYAMLGVSEANIRDAKGMLDKTPFPGAALPIHPKIAAHFGLRFASAETRYAYYDEGGYTFSEYVLRYMKHEWNEELHGAIHGGGEPARRLEALDRALARSPNSAMGWRVRAELMLQLARSAEAVESSRRALSLEAGDPEIWATHYRACSAARDKESLKATVTHAVKRFPHASVVKRIEADYAFHSGDEPRAFAAARDAVRFASGDAHAHGFLSDLAMKYGRFEEAISEMRTAAELAPSEPHFGFHLANVLQRAGRTEESEAVLQQIVASGQPDSGAHARIGDIKLNKGELDAAIAHFKQAIELDGENIHARKLLAVALERRGELDDARRLVEDLLKRYESDAHLHAQLGWIYRRGEDFAAAADAYRAAVKHDGKTPAFQKELAFALEQQGKLDEARSIIDAIVERGDADSHIYVHQAHLHERFEHFAVAEGAYRKGIAMNRGEAGFYIAYANLLERLGRPAEAARTLEDGIAAKAGAAELGSRLDQLRQAHSLG